MLTIIAAMDREGGIGYEGGLPWPRISTEMTHFSRATKAADLLIAGSLTWAGLSPRLQKRVMRISRESKHDQLDTVWEQAKSLDVWVIGGGQLYTLFLPFADRLVLSYIDGSFPADTFFPTAEFRADAPFAFSNPYHWEKNPASPFPRGWQRCLDSGYRFWVDDLVRVNTAVGEPA